MRIAAIAALALATLLLGCAGEVAGPASSPSETPSLSPAAGASSSMTTGTEMTPVSEDAPALAAYSDRRNRFVIQYPAWWQETNLRQLGDADVYGIEVVGFADHGGPMVGDCYANLIQVNILEDRVYDESLLTKLQDSLPKTLERLRNKNHEVAVLEPWTGTQIAGAPAMTMTLCISDDGQQSIGWDCVLVAQQRAYELEFFTVEEDWETYEPLFRQIVDCFKIDGT